MLVETSCVGQDNLNLDLVIYAELMKTQRVNLDSLREDIFQSSHERICTSQRSFSLSRLVSADYAMRYENEVELASDEELIDFSGETEKECYVIDSFERFDISGVDILQQELDNLLKSIEKSEDNSPQIKSTCEEVTSSEFSDISSEVSEQSIPVETETVEYEFKTSEEIFEEEVLEDEYFDSDMFSNITLEPLEDSSSGVSSVQEVIDEDDEYEDDEFDFNAFNNDTSDDDSEGYSEEDLEDDEFTLEDEDSEDDDFSLENEDDDSEDDDFSFDDDEDISSEDDYSDDEDDDFSLENEDDDSEDDDFSFEDEDEDEETDFSFEDEDDDEDEDISFDDEEDDTDFSLEDEDDFEDDEFSLENEVEVPSISAVETKVEEPVKVEEPIKEEPIIREKPVSLPKSRKSNGVSSKSKQSSKPKTSKGVVKEKKEVVKDFPTPKIPNVVLEKKADSEFGDRDSEPKDLREFLRKHPHCDVSIVYKYFTKKEVQNALLMGKVVKKGSKLHI